MVAAGICIIVALVFCWQLRKKERPLDPDEIRILRRLSDRIRSEQVHPFE